MPRRAERSNYLDEIDSRKIDFGDFPHPAWETTYQALSVVSDAVWSLRLEDGRVEFANRAARELTGTAAGDPWPHERITFCDPDAWDRCRLGREAEAVLRARWETPSGKFVSLDLVCRRIDSGNTARLLLVARETARQVVTRDPLTGVASRACLQERLSDAWKRYRQQGEHFAVLFVDLNRFKQVNDELGHLVGDRVLQAAAGRLAGCVRARDTIIRYGGDEFVLLIDGVSHRTEAERVADRIQAALRPPIVVESHSRVLEASIGIAVASQADSERRLLEIADRDMLRRKESRPA